MTARGGQEDNEDTEVEDNRDDLIAFFKPADTWMRVGSDGTSVEMTRLGGWEYEVYTESRCKVCTSKDYRRQIELSILHSESYASIARGLPEEVDITWRNIRSHFHNGHMPHYQMMRRLLIEERAQELGRDVDQYQTWLADGVTLARMGIQEVFRRLMDGEVVPTIREAIQLMKFLANVEENAGGGLDQEMMVQVMMTYIKAVQAETSPDQLQRITERIENSPTIRALEARATLRLESESV